MFACAQFQIISLSFDFKVNTSHLRIISLVCFFLNLIDNYFQTWVDAKDTFIWNGTEKTDE